MVDMFGQVLQMIFMMQGRGGNAVMDADHEPIGNNGAKLYIGGPKVDKPATASIGGPGEKLLTRAKSASLGVFAEPPPPPTDAAAPAALPDETKTTGEAVDAGALGPMPDPAAAAPGTDDATTKKSPEEAAQILLAAMVKKDDDKKKALKA